MENQLRVTNISKSYGSLKALDQVTLTLNNGVTGLLGHNGAGKSTLIKILTGNIKADQGEVSFNGEAISQMGLAYHDILAYLPQQQNLRLELSVLGFLEYFAALKQRKGVDFSGILDHVHLSAYKDKKVKDLSGGMKQRLLLGQALINEPKILLLDEPTAGLDPVERRNFRNLIADLSEDTIILMATHVISDLEMVANHLVFLKEGRVVDQGSQEYFASKIKVFESRESEEELRKRDAQLVIVNKIRDEKGLNLRFISHADFENRVSTNLDDIYLGVLQ